MKQIGIRLEEELIKKVKQYGLDNNISLQNIVSEALTSYLDNKLAPISPDSDDKKITSKKDNKLSIKQDNKLETPAPKKKEVILEPTPVKPLEEDDDYDQSLGGLFHLVPKTAEVGKPATSMRQYKEGSISWMIIEGCRPHFDKHGKPIPFRFTDEEGIVFEPDAEDLQEISREYGKQVMIEE